MFAAVDRPGCDAGLILLDELVLQPGAGLPSLVGRGLVPLVLLAAAVFGFSMLLLIKRFGASKGERRSGGLCLFFGRLAVLTVTGVWFRGPGMALVWPWGVGG